VGAAQVANGFIDDSFAAYAPKEAPLGDVAPQARFFLFVITASSSPPNIAGHSRDDWRRQDKPPNISKGVREGERPYFLAAATAARILAITSA
jgi:hypothetical protein